MSVFITLLIFVICAIVTWMAGIWLAKTTDSLDHRFKLGDALGGMILLGISGSLPELAICYAAAKAGQLDVVIGTLLGGIAIQTLVIVIFDLTVKGKRPLSYLAGTALLSLETLLAMILTGFAIMGALIKPQNSWLHTNPMSWVLVLIWVIGLMVINKIRRIPLIYKTAAEEAQLGRKHHERRAVENHPAYAKKSTGFVLGVFALGSILTLIAGVFLERTGSSLADHFGIGSGIFAATVLALVSALPEISTGVESVLMGDNQLAISDIIGGNAFMIIIFLFSDLVARKPVLSYTNNSSAYFGLLGVIMMGVYAMAYIHPPQKRILRMGFDSILQVLIYSVGLYYITIFIK